MQALVKISAIAAGGALGAVARRLINISPLANVFQNLPLPTFVINITGSFLIGFLLILLTDRFEIYGLTSDRQHSTALLYLLLSVVGGFVAVVAGARIGRLFV